jgi:hypothetical protein
MSAGTAPTRPLAPQLPFDDPARDDQWFENAVRDLLRRSGYENVEFYGGPGDRQEGIDIRADRGGEHYGVQAKKREAFRENDTTDAIAAAVYPANRYILALSRRATVGVHRAIDRTDGRWQLLDKVALSDMVRDLPHEQAVSYIELHFHGAYVETFLGCDRARTFIDRERFFSPFVDPDALIFHGWDRADSAQVLDSVRALVIDSEHRVVVASAPVGGGKSKVVFDLTDTVLDRLVCFVAPGATITADALAEVRDENACIIVDDAESVKDLAVLLGFAVSRPSIKLVLTASRAARREVVDTLLEIGFPRGAIAEVDIPRLRRADTVALVHQVMRRDLPELEDAIVRYASDTPLSTLLTARIVREQRAGVSGVSSVGEVKALIRALYRDIALGNVSSGVAREDVRTVLELIAITGPARLEQDDWVERALFVLAWERDRLLRVLDAIDDSGVLVRQGFHYSIAPELLRQAVVLESCVAAGRATMYPLRVNEGFPLNVRFLRNVAMADLELSEDRGPEVFRPLWEVVVEQVRTAHSADRASFLEHLNELAALKPVECLRLIRELYDSPATNDDEQPFGHIYTVTHEAVVREFPSVLRTIAYAAPKRVPEVVRLLWRLAGESFRWTHETPVSIIRGLAEIDPRVDVRVAELVVRTIGDLLTEGTPDLSGTVLIDLVGKALARDVTLSTSTHTQLHMRRAVVDVEATRRLRDAALSLVAQVARGDDDRRSDHALKLLASVLADPTNLPRLPTAQEREAWDREAAMAFEVFDELIANGTYPLRSLRMLGILPWHARYARSEFVRTNATRVLQRIDGDPEVSRFRALTPEFTRFDSFVDVATVENAFGEAERIGGEFFSRVAADYCERNSEPAPLLGDVEARLERCAVAGIQASPQTLFGALAAQDWAFGDRLLMTIVDGAWTAFYRSIDVLLRPVFLRDVDRASEIADRLLGTGDGGAIVAVANAAAVRGSGQDESANVRERLFSRVLTSPDRDVRMRATHPFLFFANDYPERGVRVILSVHIGSDGDFADELFMGLPHDIEGIDSDQIPSLLEKAHEVDDLPHWVFDFLRRLASTRAQDVARFFAWRFQHGPDRPEYRPIPYANISFDQFIDEFVNAPDFDEAFAIVFAAQESMPGRHRFFFDMFIGRLARVAPDRIKAAVLTALESSDSERRADGLRWLHAMPHEAVASDVDFIVTVVEHAVRIGRDFARVASTSVLNAVTAGAEAVPMYGPAPSDERLQGVASAALERSLSPDAREIFEQLLEAGVRSAEHTIRRSEDVFGPQ